MCFILNIQKKKMIGKESERERENNNYIIISNVYKRIYLLINITFKQRKQTNKKKNENHIVIKDTCIRTVLFTLNKKYMATA